MAETRSKKTPGHLRHILGKNVAGLMDKVLAGSANKPLALSKKAGMSLSNIQRILKADQGASIDKVEELADALDVFAYQLLIPDLDCQNPQIANGATPAERHLYARMRSAKPVEIAVAESGGPQYKKVRAKRKKSDVEK